MTKAIQLRFSIRHTRRLDIPGFGLVSFSPVVHETAEVLTGIVVNVGSNSLTLSRFARAIISPNPGNNEFLPSFLCIFGSADLPFCALAGLQRIIFLKPDCSLIESFSFQRKLDDDLGWFHTDCIGLEDGFVIIYESGILRLSHDAKVLWKQSLTYHDMYVGRDGDRLRFATDLESGDIKEWAISLQRGTLQENK